MATTTSAYLFGPFRLDPARAALTRDGVPITLSARAFEVLHLLARREGGIVTRDELLAVVWRGVTVEENNLTVQVSALRRALGESAGGAPIIITVPNQGYRLAGPVHREALAGGPKTPPAQRLQAAATSRIGLVALGVAAVCAAGGVAWFAATRRAAEPPRVAAQPAAAPRLSLVILPFRNLGDDKRDDTLADAISDDLTTEMAHMPAATVIARQSADSFRGRAVPTDEIGRALNVRYVLEASIRGEAANFSVNAQLVEAATGAHLWAARFDVPRTPVDDAQSAIVRRLASELRKNLILVEGARSLKERPTNPDALDLYLRAGVIWANETSRDADIQSRGLLEQAIKLQPDFTPALAELGWEIAVRNRVFKIEGVEADLTEARTVLAHALQLDRYDPNTLAAHGAMLAIDHQYAEAEANYRAALNVDPNCSHALNGLWRMQAGQGKFQDSYDTLSRLQIADPANPDAVFWNVQKGNLSVWLGRPAEGAALIRAGLAGEPDPVPGGPVWDTFGYHRVYLAVALAMSGDLDQARRILASDNKVWPHRTIFRFADLHGAPELRNPLAVKIFAALQQAGMPLFADEHYDDGVAPQATPQDRGDFDSTPLTIPGIPTIDTPALAKLLLASPKPSPAPLLVDTGMGITWPPGELRMDQLDPLSASSVHQVMQHFPGPAGRPVVVFGDGPYGWRSYNTALQLKAAGVANVLWYRGGEEGWTKAGLPGDSLFPKELR